MYALSETWVFSNYPWWPLSLNESDLSSFPFEFSPSNLLISSSVRGTHLLTFISFDLSLFCSFHSASDEESVSITDSQVIQFQEWIQCIHFIILVPFHSTTMTSMDWVFSPLFHYSATTSEYSSNQFRGLMLRINVLYFDWPIHLNRTMSAVVANVDEVEYHLRTSEWLKGKKCSSKKNQNSQSIRPEVWAFGYNLRSSVLREADRSLLEENTRKMSTSQVKVPSDRIESTVESESEEDEAKVTGNQRKGDPSCFK